VAKVTTVGVLAFGQFSLRRTDCAVSGGPPPPRRRRAATHPRRPEAPP
jgi:hypothetical protein